MNSSFHWIRIFLDSQAWLIIGSRNSYPRVCFKNFGCNVICTRCFAAFYLMLNSSHDFKSSMRASLETTIWVWMLCWFVKVAGLVYLSVCLLIHFRNCYHMYFCLGLHKYGIFPEVPSIHVALLFHGIAQIFYIDYTLYRVAHPHASSRIQVLRLLVFQIVCLVTFPVSPFNSFWYWV